MRANTPKAMNVNNDQRDPEAAVGELGVRRWRTPTHRVREARDRLISSTGTRLAFDYELLRLFAQNRFSASLVILLLVTTVGFLSSLWIGAVNAGIWTCAVLMIHATVITHCRQFLAEPPKSINFHAWRLRFIMLDLFFGLAWMFNLIHPRWGDDGSSTFMLFVMLLVVAVSSMLASSVPIAVFAATVPVSAVTVFAHVHRCLSYPRHIEPFS
jgi:two-component system, cell cycle sensor histidine kinase PleC